MSSLGTRGIKKLAMKAPRTGSDVARGTIYMILAAFLFSMGATSARFVASDLNVLVLVFWTNLGMFILMCGAVSFKRPNGGLGTEKLPQHFLRSVFTYAALVTYFYALAEIPFANAVILQSLGPLFVPVLAFVIFRRLSDRYVWFGVLISFAGVTLIIQPGDVGMSLGDAAAVLAALGGAAAALVVWSLSATEPADRQMFYFSLFALLLSAVPLPWTWQWPSILQSMQIMCAATFTIVGQFFYAKAFSAAPGDKVITWSYMSIVFAAGIGFVAWGEPILAATAVGAAMVVGGAHLATRERKVQKPPKQSVHQAM